MRHAMLATLIAATFMGAVAPASGPAVAQDAFPAKPIRILVGFSTGSSTDVATRLVADAMGETLGQRVVVENRPGAASNVATQAVATAEPDGYTLLMGTVANTINTALGRKVAFAFPEDFAPVSTVGAVPMILVVHPDIEAQTVEDLVELIKTRDEPLLYGSAGVGTAPHLSAEMFAAAVGGSMTHVPYQGSGDAVRDLVAGRIDVLFAPQSSAIAQIEDGKLRPLASSLTRRSAMLPDVPTIDETVMQGFDTSVWFGLMAPHGTPGAVIARLNSAVNEALESDSVRSGFANAGIEPLGGTPDALSQYISREIGNWSTVVEDANITVE